MKAGQLDKRILLQRPVVVRDEHGGEVTGWVDVATVWAHFKRVKGDESVQAEQRTNRQDAEFTIRYRPGLDPEMTLVYDGERWEIDDVGEPEGSQRRELLLLTAHAREVTSGG